MLSGPLVPGSVGGVVFMGLWMVGRRVGGGGRIGGALFSVFVSFGDVVSGSLAEGAGAVMAGSVRFSTGAASVTIKYMIRATVSL